MTSRRSIIVSLMLGLFLSLFSLLEANAQVPRSISYQGQLIKSNLPYNGTVSLEIKIYTAGGAELYTETYTGVQVKDGIFNVLLGGNDGHLPGTLKFDQQYFLGINVDGSGELNPRTPFVAAPYALNSQTVGGVGVATVPTPGMLLPLDANGKVPPAALPQLAPDAIVTINLVDGSATNNIDLISSNGSINILPNQAAHTIDLTINPAMVGAGDITDVVAGNGLMGGGSVGSVQLDIKPNGITTDMLGTGVVTGIKLDQFVAGNGLVQDALGNLHINTNATLEIVGDVLGINLANPNTWTALQTFNAGITVNGTLTHNGLHIHVGNTNQTGNFNLTGNLVVTGTSDLQGNIFNSSANNGGAVTIGDNFLVNGNSTFNGTITHNGDHTQIGNWTGTGTWTHTGNMSNTGNFTQTGNITNTGNVTNTGNSAVFNVNAGVGNNFTINGIPEPTAINNASVTNFEFIVNADMDVRGFSWLRGNTQIGGNTTIAGTLGVTGATTLSSTLNVAGATTLNGLTNNGTSVLNGATTINNTLNVTGASTFNGITNNGTLTQNGVSTFNNTLNVTGPNVTNLGGAVNITGLTTANGGINSNGTLNQVGATNITGLVTLTGNMNQTGNMNITGTLANTGNVALASNNGTVNTFGGLGSSNRFNGTSNFGSLPASNGNKLIVDGAPNMGVPTLPTGFPGGFVPPADFEEIVNGDLQVTGFTHLNNATVNGTLVIMGGIVFPPAAVACLNTLQVQTLTSWCGGPAGAAIALGTALSQTSLGTSGSNTFLATTVNGALTQTGGANVTLPGGPSNTFGNLAGVNAINGNTTVTGTFTVTGTMDAQNNIVNTTGNNAGRVQINDELRVTGNSVLDGLANTYAPLGAGTHLELNPIAINPPIGNEVTPNATNTFRGHNLYVGNNAGANERKIYVDGQPEGPGILTPDNTVPPVQNFEVEIKGDLYVQGAIVGGNIPQIRSYTVTLVPASGPNGGGSVTFAPAGGYDANDAVHMSYMNFGTAQGYLVYDSPVAGSVRIESSSALDNANVRVTVVRYP
jgi:hypothetical protein